MCSYKSLLPQSCAVSSHRQGEELDRNAQLQVLIAVLSQLQVQSATHRQREELDSYSQNVQLQVLIASELQLVLTDREKN